MPATVRIIVSQHGDLAAWLRHRAASLDAQRQRFVALVAAEAMADASELAPARTGHLRRGFQQAHQSARFEEAPDRTTATMINTVRYAGFVEYGTRRMAARAMLRRALNALRSKLPRLWTHAGTHSR